MHTWITWPASYGIPQFCAFQLFSQKLLYETCSLLACANDKMMAILHFSRLPMLLHHADTTCWPVMGECPGRQAYF